MFHNHTARFCLDTVDGHGLCRVTRHLPECAMPSWSRGGYTKKWKTGESGCDRAAIESFKLEPICDNP